MVLSVGAGTSKTWIAVSHTSIRMGVRIGLGLCVVLAVFIALSGHRIKMRNAASGS
jgi:hypothetical protein